ncbi:MAG: NTP transferase domain-containing protein [Pirellulales bacterium]|nr:NTP transferase domain-containing protein [Pirellulales bacterium]
MSTNKPIVDDTVVVILAAGKGTRMGRDDQAKVCFEIDGAPAINRTIAAFKKNRFSRFVLVLGDRAEQVLQTVDAKHPGAMYVYQHPQLGTGHAGRIAADALATMGHEGHVFVSMGDKHIEPVAIETLVAGYVKLQPDMALLTLPRPKGSDAPGGRVLLDSSGQAVDIIEQADLAKQSIVDELTDAAARNGSVSADEIRDVVARHLPKPDKQKIAVPELLELARRRKTIDAAALARLFDEARYHLEIDGRHYSARQIDGMCTGLNPSLYLFRAEAFYTGMGLLCNDNAQGEYYITDVIRRLASVRDERGAARYKIRSVPAGNRDWVQGFNSPDELLAIADYVRRKKLSRAKAASQGQGGRPRLKPNQYATVRQWLSKIEAGRPSLGRWLTRIYGKHDALHEAKTKDLAAVLACFGKQFGFDEKVCIVRAPGRVNLMGRHVDHRGGSTNFLAIDRETIAVASPRDDNNVVAVSTRPRQFKPVRFNVSELIGRFGWSDWINFVNSDWVRNLLYGAAGDWGNYVKAAMLRLQHQFQDVQVRGLNLAVHGNVPMAAGLSSSSTLVVATLQAAIALNGFELTSRQFIDLCGEGEWFVGSRGGAGDHAAIYLGQRGKIAHVGYLPFRVERILDAPKNYQLVIANSHVKAAKSAAAKHTFNEKVAAYNLGLALLKQRCPEVAASLQHVRDIDPERLGRTTSDIYRMLLKVPQFMTRRDFRSMFSSEHADLLDVNFATHDEPDRYNPRGILLYGAAEIMRSRMCGDLLQEHRIEELGRLMNVSHDGDRISRRAADGAYQMVEEPYTDACLNQLISDLASEDPARVLGAQLYMQPGAYRCSTPEIDRMVDVVREAPGVVGAQLAGAGLGGCIMILAHRDRIDAARKALVDRYYRPKGLKPDVLPCIATDGAGLAEF